MFIRNDARIEVVKFHNKEKFNPYIAIGDNVSIEQRLHLTAASYLCIEKGATILFDVMIADIDHDYNDITQPISKQNLIIKKTSIGENCFIGSGAKIQAGTILGKHCVIGANSVVRGHFPDYCVIVGVPARIIKKYDFACKEWKKTDKYGTFLDE